MARAHRESSVLPDAASREEIRTSLDTTLLVEAGAGSGKTTMLVTRMVALLAAGKARAENLAAVTFTRKAASHLRRSFQAALEGAAKLEADETRRAHLAAALRSLDRLVLGTIDSFCALLLSERPLEAGLDPSSLRVELQEARLFLQRCFREFAGRRAETGGPLASLLDLGVRMNELEESFELLAEFPDVTPQVSDPLELPDFTEPRRRVEDFLRRAIPAVPARAHEKGRDELQKKLLQAQDALELPDHETPAGFARFLSILRPAGGATQYKWPDKAEAKRLDGEFEALREQVVKPALGAWQRALHERIMAVLQPALDDLQRRRAREGFLTYADLLLAARNLLRDFPAVRRAFAARFTHLLVDEFQDTDPLQAEILLYLSSADFDEKEVARLRPRAGSLFVVGDPKQSIYRFRRADIASYMAFRATLQESGGRVVHLTANFRAVPSLANAANAVFRDLFPAEPTERQAAFSPLQPVRGEGGDRSGAFRLVTRVASSGAPELAHANAPDVARFVRWAVDTKWEVSCDGPVRGARFADFLVLTRTRDFLDVYARAFEVFGIPVDLSGSKALPISKGLAELRPLLSAIQNPDDDVSIVAFLSGPLCGVDDDALYAFRRLGGRFTYLVDPPPAADPRIAEGLALLAVSRQDVRTRPAGAALALICDRLGVVARLAARPDGRTSSGNLLKVLALARRLSGEGLAFRDIVERIAEDAPALDLEEMSVEPIDADAVRLMNLHRAKGLEAPIVVLAEPRDVKVREPKKHVVRGVGGSRGWFTAGYEMKPRNRPPQWNVIATPPDWDLHKADEMDFEKAEKTRLLYVAATRARDTLVVSLKEDKPADAAWAPLRNELKDLPRAAAEFQLPPAPATTSLASALPEARKRIAEGRLRAGIPSFAVTPVTNLAKKEGPRAPTAAEEAHGTAWGRVLHRLLEAAMRADKLELRPFAENLLREEELRPELLDGVLRVAKSVTASPLWVRARKARRRFVEAPFAMMVSSAELGVSGGPEETLLKGAIDLVFEEDGVWYIVDWKSDVVGDSLAALVAHYAPQIVHYRKAWEALTKQRAVAGLYFMDNGHLEWLESTGRRPTQASLPFEEN